MKLFCLRIIKDHEDPEISYTVAENETKAEDNTFNFLMRYENSFLTKDDEPHTRESIEDLYQIEDLDQVPDKVNGYKIILTKI